MNVLIIGLGSIAMKHIVAIKKIEPESKIFALRSNPKAADIAGIKNVFSWDEAFDAGPYDFAIISNPTSEHGKTIERLIKFNCPLFIEKPVLSSYTDAPVLEKMLADNNIFSYIACNLRFHPGIKFIREYLSETKPLIQEVNAYCGSYLPDWRPNQDFRTVYSANAELGGGVHLDLIHEIDYLVWFFGQPDEHYSFLRSKSALKITAIDFAHYVMVYNAFVTTVTLNYYRRQPKRTLEILTDSDVIEVNLLTMEIRKNKVLIFTADFKMEDTYTAQIQFFMDAVKNKVAPMNDFNEAVQTLKITLG